MAVSIQFLFSVNQVFCIPKWIPHGTNYKLKNNDE